jgi:hypothetical protein
MGPPKRRDFTVGDIKPTHTITALCSRCGHEQVVPHRILRRRPDWLLLIYLEPKLRCIVCRHKGTNWLSIE